MDWSTIGALIARHALSAAAGTLATHGLIGSDPSATEAFVGAGMLLVGVGWSAWQKYGQVLVDKRKAELSNLHPDTLKAP